MRRKQFLLNHKLNELEAITPTEKKNETNSLMVYSVLKGLLVPSNINSKEFHLTIVQLNPVKLVKDEMSSNLLQGIFVFSTHL